MSGTKNAKNDKKAKSSLNIESLKRDDLLNLVAAYAAQESAQARDLENLGKLVVQLQGQIRDMSRQNKFLNAKLRKFDSFASAMKDLKRLGIL